MRRKLGGLGLGAVMVCCAACGSDGPSAPASADVAGTWVYRSAMLSGDGVECDFYGLTLSLVQSGQRLLGSYEIPLPQCFSLNGAFIGPAISGTLNGTVTGSALMFDFAQSGVVSSYVGTGVLASDSLSGTATMRMPLGGEDTATLTGTWSAERQ